MKEWLVSITQKDWVVRAAKTFVQTFGGVLIPELVMLLNGTIPSTIEGWKIALVPVLCAALGAGISAVWNIINEHLREDLK